MEKEKFLELNDLYLEFKVDKGSLKALEGISFYMKKGEILGLVGESGCGKSITALSIVGLLPNTAKISKGEIWFKGETLQNMKEENLRKIRGKEISMIFQEPMTSLNPVLNIGEQVMEHAMLHLDISRSEARKLAIEMLKSVGLSRAEELLKEYPHQLSGGMKQRVMIALALICRPELIIADEPTTALDVTIQAQILDLLKKINKEFETSILFISHDLGVINELCDRVLVMYAGEIVESAKVKDLFINPIHPYTIGLMDSIPAPEKKGKELYFIPGRIPGLEERKGDSCRFSPRCPKAQDICFKEHPKVYDVTGEHKAMCILAEKEES